MLNKEYGYLTVIKEVEKKKSSKGENLRQVACLCKCGVVKIVVLNDLKSGKTTSCGCKRSESNTTHGMRNTPEYYSWRSMIKRCCEPQNTSYHRYGGRGIKVCDSWRNSFMSFYEDMGARPEGNTLDRIDVNGDYTKTNCRWTTVKNQNNNKRNVKTLEYDGVKKTIKEWYEYYNLSDKKVKYTTFQSRIVRLGWSLSDAVVGKKSQP